MTRKIAFFERWSWFKFNNLGLALGTNLKFCTSVAKRLKLRVRKFWGPNPTFVEVSREKLAGGPFCPSPILNRVNTFEWSFWLIIINTKNYRIPSKTVTKTLTYLFNQMLFHSLYIPTYFYQYFFILVGPNKQFLNVKLLRGFPGQLSKS